MEVKAETRVIDDPDHTPNPDRAIWVEGRLDEALLDRLRPRILELTNQSREPITVFINSSGGHIVEGILRLLKRTTQEDPRPSRIITVAAPKAASAAANLLSAGDWAIAPPLSRLLYHGARWPMPDGELTVEWARIAQALLSLHEVAAAELSRSSVGRFLSIVSIQRPLFAQRRADTGQPTVADLDCFQNFLRGNLSPAGRKVLDLAIPLFRSYNGLLLRFQKRLRRGRVVSKTSLRRSMLHASSEFEYESSETDSAFDGGMSRISDHFYFLNAYFDLARLCEWVAMREQPQLNEAEIEEAYLLQFRLFFLAMCRALQEGENYLTPSDAVWLGLIDTVRDFSCW
jgi:ATP-dependent protease ClpP protease subunit